jgi:hypothetical protein
MKQSHIQVIALMCLLLATNLWAGNRATKVGVDQSVVITNPGNSENRSLAKYALDSLLLGRHVEYAEIEIQFAAPADGAEFYTAHIFPLKKAFRRNASWSDNFTRKGVDYYQEYGISVTVAKRDGYKTKVLVNSLIQLWADGTIENHGFIVVSPDKGVGKAKIKNTSDAVSKLTLYHEKAD